MKEQNVNRRSALLDTSGRSIRMCEAVDCYEAATEIIVIPVGKFGTINLNLCHECAVTKFQITTSVSRLLGSKKHSRVEGD